MKDHFEAGEGRAHVVCDVRMLGDDMLVIVGGGEKHHCGTVVVSDPVEKKRGIRASSSVMNYKGHKDELVVRMMTEGLCVGLKKKVVGVGGIHIKKATEEELLDIKKSCEEILADIIEERLG